jgi:hypothetical protein
LGLVAGCSLSFAPAALADDPWMDLWAEQVAKGWGDMAAQVGEKWEKAVKSKLDFETRLAQVRRDFWKAYPDGPGIEQLQKEYSQLLFDKDLSYMLMALVAGEKSIATVLTAHLQPDGGIPPVARKACSAWINALRAHLGAGKDGDLVFLTHQNFLSALKATQGECEQYALLRNWHEFHRAGRDKEFYPTPEKYVHFLFRTGPNACTKEEAATIYRQMTQTLGEEHVRAAAETARTARKTSMYLLPPDGQAGAGKAIHPMTHLLRLVAKSSDRNFVLCQIALEKPAVYDWPAVEADAQAMLDVLGEDRVLAAAAALRPRPDATRLKDLVEKVGSETDFGYLATEIAQREGAWGPASRQIKALSHIYGREKVLEVARYVRTGPREVVTIRDDRGGVLSRTEFVKAPDKYEDLKGRKLYPYQAIHLFLQREPRRNELPLPEPHVRHFDLSNESQLTAAELPKSYMKGDMAVDAGRVAIGASWPFVSTPAPKSEQPPPRGFGGGAAPYQPPAGLAMVFQKDGDRSPMKLSNPHSDHSFGTAIDLDGDIVVVGAPGVKKPVAVRDRLGRTTRTARQVGSAYTFDAKSGNFLAMVGPNESDIENFLEFGASVAAQDEVIVVGAPLRSKVGAAPVDRSKNTGAVYVFGARDGKLVRRIGPQGGFARRFGESVATDGRTMIVGAPGGVANAGTRGEAFLYNFEDGSLLARLEAPRGDSCPSFGQSVAVDGQWAIVGAPRMETRGAGHVGAAYVYEVPSGKLLAVLKVDQSWRSYGKGSLVDLIVDRRQKDAKLGQSVAIVGPTVLAASASGFHLFDASSGLRLAHFYGTDGPSVDFPSVDFDGRVAVLTGFYIPEGQRRHAWAHYRVDLTERLAELRKGAATNRRPAQDGDSPK